MDQPDAVFHVDTALRKSTCYWADNEIRFFGRLCVGELSIGDTIRIPLVGGGFVEAIVTRFTENVTDEWIGLPFYDTVCPESRPFCICVDGRPVGQSMIKLPSQLEKHSEQGDGRAITLW